MRRHKWFIFLTIVFLHSPAGYAKNCSSNFIPPGIIWTSSDCANQLKLGGRLLLDTAEFQDDKSLMDLYNEDRRFRLTLKGKLAKVWKLKASFEFSDPIVEYKEISVAYSGVENFRLRAGHFAPPLGLNLMSSSNKISFMERPMVSKAFDPDNRLGGDILIYNDNWTLNAALFGHNINEDTLTEEGGGAAIRGTFTPLMRDDLVFHLGGSFMYLTPDEILADPNKTGTETSTSFVRVRARPESHLMPRLVDTKKLYFVDHTETFGLELALAPGPFLLQGEYMRQNIDSTTNGDPSFDGFYISGSWVFNNAGKNRPYNRDEGVFEGIKPVHPLNFQGGGWGAWELATRFSSLDLNDGSIMGGHEQNTSLGVNWYPNKWIRLMVNHTWVNTDQSAGDIDMELTTGRLQITF